MTLHMNATLPAVLVLFCATLMIIPYTPYRMRKRSNAPTPGGIRWLFSGRQSGKGQGWVILNDVIRIDRDSEAAVYK